MKWLKCDAEQFCGDFGAKPVIAVALLDDEGTVIERYEYDAYGKPTIWNADFTIEHSFSYYGNPYCFTGRRVDFIDEFLLLQYSRNRYYDYFTCRWLTPDDMGYVDGMNLYQYLISNPVNKTDPSGLFGLCFWGYCIGDEDYPSFAFGGEQYYDPDPGNPYNDMSLLDILLSLVRGRAGVQISDTLCVPWGVGKGCLTFNGMAWWNDCCDGRMRGGHCMGEFNHVICFRGSIDAYYHFGTDIDTDDEDELVPWEVMEPMDMLGSSLGDSHYQQSGGYAGIGKLNECQTDMFDFDMKLRGFVRGAAGIGVIGVRGSLSLELYSLDEGFPTSWEEVEENTDFKVEAASGIYGASIEAGISGSVDLCILLGKGPA